MAAITLNRTVNGGTVGTAKDIVLVDKVTGLSCSLAFVHAEATLDFTETSQFIDNGADAGLGIYDITGDIVLYQNDTQTAKGIQLHEGNLYDVHVLFTNGDALSTRLTGAKALSAAVLARYRNILAFKQFYGVALKIQDKMGGSARGLHILVSGNTAIKDNWTPASDGAFYSKIEALPIGNSTNIN